MHRPSPRRRSPRLTHRLPLRLEWLEDRVTPSPLVFSGTTRRDLVYDPVRDLLYITTSTGAVQRYDPASNSLLSPIAMPGSSSLAGADITPDGGTLLAADTVPGASTGVVRRIDLATG